MSVGNGEKESTSVLLIDDTEELGDQEQIFHEAFKRKCDQTNQTGSASEQKKMKIAVAAGSHPLIEPVQLTCKFSLPSFICWYFDINLESR